MIQVYTKSECIMCEYTLKKLAEFHVPHEELPMNDDIVKLVEDKGLLMHSPVVITPTTIWTGFKIDKLKALRTAQTGRPLGSA
jgi:arsenate reductase-like glutaredoxin family protein